MGSKTVRKISMGVIKVSTSGQVVCVTSKQQKDGAFAETLDKIMNTGRINYYIYYLVM